MQTRWSSADRPGKMTVMPRPTKVWMVPLERAPTVEIVGELRLDEHGLLFTPRSEETPATRLRFDTVAKITRLRGSPVVMVTHADGSGARTKTAFYFTQPPTLKHIVKSRTPEPAVTDLHAIPRPSPFGLGQRKPSKRKSLRANAAYLTQEGTSRRHELQEWVDEVRERLRSG
jgi:hypothetical protein